LVFSASIRSLKSLDAMQQDSLLAGSLITSSGACSKDSVCFCAPARICVYLHLL
jgi:hypothetical protein